MFNIRDLNINKDWTLFLDRDGVINKQAAPHDYIKTVAEFEFLPDALAALPKLAGIFGKIIIITNQRGIARKLMTESNLQEIHQHMKNEIERHGGRLDGIYHCPHDYADECQCRKPGSALYHKAKENFLDINFSKSIKVGNSQADILSARPLGMATVYLGNIEFRDFAASRPDFIYPDLRALANNLFDTFWHLLIFLVRLGILDLVIHNMANEIKENGVYTTQEVQDLLKISESTVKRLLKRGILRANKVGGQYRIMGKEILRLISPELEKKSEDIYMKIKKRAVDVINKWPQ